MKLAIITVILASTRAFAQTDYVMPSPLVLAHGETRVVIPQRDTKGPHDWYSDSCRGSIETSVLHVATKKDGILYILFTCEGWSKGGENRNGRCGAGMEKQINWMAIKDGKVVSDQRRDIISCWQDAEGKIIGWKDSQFLWESDERDGIYKCFFDSSHPEKGIEIESFQKAEQDAAANP